MVIRKNRRLSFLFTQATEKWFTKKEGTHYTPNHTLYDFPDSPTQLRLLEASRTRACAQLIGEWRSYYTHQKKLTIATD